MSMKDKLIIAIAILGIPVVILIMNVYSTFYPVSDRQIFGPVTISSEWLEIKPDPPLRVSRELQHVILDIQEPCHIDEKSFGVRVADGSVVTPEVELVDEQANTYYLTAPTIFYSPGTPFPRRGFSTLQLPPDRRYRLVRIRCEKPVTCSAIIWDCRDGK